MDGFIDIDSASRNRSTTGAATLAPSPWQRGYETGVADHARWSAWDAAGRPGKHTPTRCPYDAPPQYMPWLDGYVAGGADARAARLGGVA